MAELPRKQTTVSQEWIADKLSMHRAAGVSTLPLRFNRVQTSAKLPSEMKTHLNQAWSSKG